ncbi:MAG: MFS transporter [Planctomycetia bacterium]|nr:MFS transporter [Planctomycetia bacterium]
MNRPVQLADSPAAAPRARPPLPANVKLLGVTSLVNDIASEMLYPLLPALLTTLLGTGYRQIGLAVGIIEGAAEAVSSVLKLFAGGWSDRTGRRKGWIVVGYAASAVAKPLMGLIVYPWQLLACRVGDRLGKGLRTSARDAVIAESTPPAIRGWAFGFHRGMDHIGAAIGPLLATGFLYLWPDRLQTLFLLSAIPGTAVIAILAFGLREPPHSVSAAEPFALSLAPFERNFRLYLLSLAVFTLGNSSDLFLLARSGELGVPEMMLPVMWFAFHVAKSTGNMLVGRVVERVGARRLIFAGWLAYAVVYLGFALADRAWHAWALFLSYAIFYSLTEPPEKTIVAQLVPGNRRGLAYGWYNFAIGVAALPASLLFGFLYKDYGALAAFSTGAGLAVVAAVLLTAVRTEPRSGEIA